MIGEARGATAGGPVDVTGDVVAAALAAAAHRLGSDRDAVLARLGGTLGGEARARAAALGDCESFDSQPPVDRRAGAGAGAPRTDKIAREERGLGGESRLLRAEWAARARAPVPAGLRGVHATWIEAALAELPARARRVLGGGEPLDEAGVWLARYATAGFAPLAAARAELPRTPADLAALAPRTALHWLASVGLDQLAHALAGQVIALGPELEAARARIAAGPRAGRLGPQRAALERCRELVPPLDGDRLAVLGARTVAPFVPALARAALALRLPKPLGERVLAALVAYAHVDRERGPTWDVLVA